MQPAFRLTSAEEEDIFYYILYSILKIMNRNTVCVILAAGHAEQLKKEVNEDNSGNYGHLKGKPKALLPAAGGKCILDYWWDVIKMRQLFTEVYLVTNADKHKYFERWSTASDFPLENLINDGSTLPCNSLGSLGDLELIINIKSLWECNVMVIAGDMLFQDSKFDMTQVLHYFHHRPDGDLAIYYEMHPSESTTSRGIIEIDSTTKRISKFLEKPKPDETTSRFASVVFYCLRSQTIKKLSSYLSDHHLMSQKTFGSFMQWMINCEKATVFGMKLPTGFQLIGDVSLEDYESWVSYFSKQGALSNNFCPFTKRIYARVGIMGNPSDGYFGKTISLSIKNFWSEVTIEESETLRLLPHPLNDPTEFGSLSDLYCVSSKEGYLGGLRLLQATCKKFYNYCSIRGIALARRNFTLSYETNIPRQVGLAGSSAIVAATLKCLMAFFNLTDSDMPKPLQPQFILDVEKEELRISAGLQDRVVQIYEGLVHMDFDRNMIKEHGHGTYKYLKVPSFPTFFLAYQNNPSDSGRIHSDVSNRWHRGEPEVIEGMSELALLADSAALALEESNWDQLASFMNQNFEIRRKLFGEDALGKDNLQMIEIGRKFGASVKFPGSGGAVLGFLRDKGNLDAMKDSFRNKGCVVIDIIPVLNPENL